MSRFHFQFGACLFLILTACLPAQGAPLEEFEAALAEGKLAAAAESMEAAIKQNQDDQQARFALGVVQFLQAVERASQSLYEYGLFGAERHRVIPLIRLPLPPNEDPKEISYEDLRGIVERLTTDLKAVEATLAEVNTSDVKLPLHLGRISLDLNGDGEAGEDETFWRIFTTYNAQVRREEATAFAIAFDGGDVHWLRGYCHLLMALGDVALAHDWHDLFERSAHRAFAQPKTPHKFLLEERGAGAPFDWRSIADAIAAIHSTKFPVVEPKRMASAHGHLREMIRQSRASWTRILAETDDDREWIPNPTQTGVIPGVRINQEMIDSWHSFLDECENLLAGDKLVPFWRGYKEKPEEALVAGRGVNLRRVFFEPKEFDLVLWITGTGATPYLEDGELTDPRVFQQLGRTFRGEFFGFAIWFN
jgi:hypothetical protein